MSTSPIANASTTESMPGKDPAAIGVWVGGLSVVGLSTLELFGVIGGCSAYQVTDPMLIFVTFGLAGGGVAALVLAAKGVIGSPRRRQARGWGIAAVVLAVVSIPINVMIIGLTSFCAVG